MLSPGLALLAEGLLAQRIAADGCAIAAARRISPNEELVSEKQLAAMIRTLAMLGTA
jgi:hypothetical protein